MKPNSLLAFLFTLIAILVIIIGVGINFLFSLQPSTQNCDGYDLFLFPDSNKLDTVIGQGQILKIRAINAGSFGDKYNVILKGPEWAVVKPTLFGLRAEESKTLFLYVSPNVGNEGKYTLDLTVKSNCISQSTTIEVGVLPRVNQD